MCSTLQNPISIFEMIFPFLEFKLKKKKWENLYLVAGRKMLNSSENKIIEYLERHVR